MPELLLVLPFMVLCDAAVAGATGAARLLPLQRLLQDQCMHAATVPAVPSAAAVAAILPCAGACGSEDGFALARCHRSQAIFTAPLQALNVKS